MSVVWRAHDQVLGRDVAVKVLSPGLARDPQLLARVRSEARAVARLRHPNVIQIYDIGEANGVPFLACEYVDGGTLEEFLDGWPNVSREAAEAVIRWEQNQARRVFGLELAPL